jgi:hypothetical protein
LIGELVMQINQEVRAVAKPDDNRSPKEAKETTPDGPLTGKDVKIVTYDMSASRLLQVRSVLYPQYDTIGKPCVTLKLRKIPQQVRGIMNASAITRFIVKENVIARRL